MNKKELTILLIIPILAVCISYYGFHQINIVNSNHQANSSITKNIEGFAEKIKSESPEQTQNNLIEHIKYTNQLLAMELKSEQEYIDVMHSFFLSAVTFSTIWVLVVLLTFFTTSKRHAT